MNENILFGERGQPAGSIEGDALFDANGDQTGFLEDQLIFDIEDGSFLGSFINGVVYNAYGHPQGFRKDAQPGIPMLDTGANRLPPKLRFTAQNVRNESASDIPAFLEGKLKPGSRF